MANLFDSILDTLSRHWKVPHKPLSKRPYRCECGQPVLVLNTHCLNCDPQPGYEPVIDDLRALRPTSPGWEFTVLEYLAPTASGCLLFPD